MALPVNDEESDEEFLEDIIKLYNVDEVKDFKAINTKIIGSSPSVHPPCCDDESEYTSEEKENDNDINKTGISHYGQRSIVLPITFFNVPRNIVLLNECRPMSIILEDCKQNPKISTCNSKSYICDLIPNSNKLKLRCKNIDFDNKCAFQSYQNRNMPNYINEDKQEKRDNIQKNMNILKENRVQIGIKKVTEENIFFPEVNIKKNTGLVGLKIKTCTSDLINNTKYNDKDSSIQSLKCSLKVDPAILNKSKFNLQKVKNSFKATKNNISSDIDTMSSSTESETETKCSVKIANVNKDCNRYVNRKLCNTNIGTDGYEFTKFKQTVSNIYGSNKHNTLCQEEKFNEALHSSFVEFGLKTKNVVNTTDKKANEKVKLTMTNKNKSVSQTEFSNFVKKANENTFLTKKSKSYLVKQTNESYTLYQKPFEEMNTLQFVDHYSNINPISSETKPKETNVRVPHKEHEQIPKRGRLTLNNNGNYKGPYYPYMTKESNDDRSSNSITNRNKLNTSQCLQHAILKNDATYEVISPNTQFKAKQSIDLKNITPKQCLDSTTSSEKTIDSEKSKIVLEKKEISVVPNVTKPNNLIRSLPGYNVNFHSAFPSAHRSNPVSNSHLVSPNSLHNHSVLPSSQTTVRNASILNPTQNPMSVSVPQSYIYTGNQKLNNNFGQNIPSKFIPNVPIYNFPPPPILSHSKHKEQTLIIDNINENNIGTKVKVFGATKTAKRQNITNVINSTEPKRPRKNTQEFIKNSDKEKDKTSYSFIRVPPPHTFVTPISGYSPPILPIPSFQKSLKILENVKRKTDCENANNLDPKNQISSKILHNNREKETKRKISLEDYIKKRKTIGNVKAVPSKEESENILNNNKSVILKQLENDLGYVSDSNIVS